MGLFFDQAFAALGGQRVGSQLTLDNSFGMGDDDGTLEDDFSAWREAVWPDVMSLLNMEDKASSEQQQFALTCDDSVLPLQPRPLYEPCAGTLRTRLARGGRRARAPPRWTSCSRAP